MRLNEGSGQEAINRERGADKLFQFLRKTLEASALSDSNDFNKLLLDINFDEFKTVMERISGILQRVPIRDRKSLDKSMSVGHESLIYNTSLEHYIAPEMEFLNGRLPDILQQVQGLMKDDKHASKSRAARTLYNMVIYSHILPNANGRSARLLYYFSSPDIVRNSVNLSTDITRIVCGRTGYGNLHNPLNEEIYIQMLKARNINLSRNRQSGALEQKIYWDDRFGFDPNNLAYISAYDVLGPQKFSEQLVDGESLLWESLTSEQRGLIENRQEQTRQEFFDRVMVFSLTSSPEADDFDKKLINLILTQ